MRTAELTSDLFSRLNLAELSNTGVWKTVPFEARPLLVSALLLNKMQKCLIVTPTYEKALQWHARLTLAGISAESISLLPSGTSTLFDDSPPEHVALSDRLGALRKLVEEVPHIVIATPQATLERTLTRELLVSRFYEIKVGDSLDIGQFLTDLMQLGYEHQEPVRQPGQFSRRGGIIDIFPVGRDTPIRLELFGDEVESLRLFDPNTQRSIGNSPELRISPSRETLYLGGEQTIVDLLEHSLLRESASLSEENALRLKETIEGDIQSLRSNAYFDRFDLYRPILIPDSGCAIDLLSPNDFLILDEPWEINAIAIRSEEELNDALMARHGRGEILSCFATDFVASPEKMGSHAKTLSLALIDEFPHWQSSKQGIEFNIATFDSVRGQAELLGQSIKTLLEQNYAVAICTDQPNRVATILKQIDIFPSERLDEGKLVVTLGNLGGGFVYADKKFALLTDAELFGVARLKLPQKRFMEGAPISTVLDLKPGDFVVHIHFGIGIFRGLVKREERGVSKEFLFIEYAPPDKLFVPADQLDRVQKYLNPSDHNPKLNRLVGSEWQKTLGKAKDEARDFARDLVKLYAKRKLVNRRSYPQDSPWQAELESTFPYVETHAQMQAIVDVKNDLEAPYPMDRLICGDVGFGKTEVAIRGAFKVIQDNRQVAVLCPTTILSEQHYRNFTERLSPFGVRIELINRFVSATQRKGIFERVKVGAIDLLIGTHALLGQGLVFKDLGLVVVDEEQKFGVKQKEMLKSLRSEVDVLTLSATPIPRTLSMALMDIRQMSLINDPPPGRLPVRSYLRSFSTDVVKEAVLRELSRGGQVFYVYNRVDSIGHVAHRLQSLVPSARIGVGHGQMSEKEIEPIMLGFIKGEIDVLLSTTIIENGIDISNANTLIVEDADLLGLSQLYQLRGRVGRSDRQAYAYFLYSSIKDVTENGLARLQALQEFSNLGSGYSLAFRDLQIRGAGELLGAKQHGAMASVGYELYSQLINEAVALLKSKIDSEPGSSPLDVDDPLETLKPLPPLDLPVAALIPDTFIRDQAQRLYYYQRLMSTRKKSQIPDLRQEIADRYGHLPEEVETALSIMLLRIKSKEVGIEKIDAKQGRISIVFENISTISPRIFSLISKDNRDFYLSKDSAILPFGRSIMESIEWFFTAYEQAYNKVNNERSLLSV